jgi:hypothetical protein
MTTLAPRVGMTVTDSEGRSIGRVDAVFADYLLIRTRGLLPVDLYVPVTAIDPGPEGEDDRLAVTAPSAEAAYEAWHRPLKRSPHD